MFSARTRLGESSAAADTGDVPLTKHRGAVNSVFPVSVSFPITKFSTAGVDGRVITWSVADAADL
jgi:hypothetical protein